MATIRLSKTGNLYQLAVNGWSKTKDLLSVVVIATYEDLDTAKEAFTGNEQIEMTDASIHITAEGYTVCRSIERIADYPVGGMDIHGDDILADVWKVELADAELPFEEPITEAQGEEPIVEA